HDRPRQHGLPRARLADDPECLPPVEIERHAVDGAHHAARGVEVCLQLGHAQQRHVGRGRWCFGDRFAQLADVAHTRLSRTSIRARTTSPRKLRLSTVKKMNNAGMKMMCGDSASLPRSPAMMLPHDGVGARTPTPRMLSVPSATMATAIPSSAIDIIAGSTLGSTSR